MTAQPFPLRNEIGAACPGTAEPVTRGSVAAIHRTAESKARPTVGPTQRQAEALAVIRAHDGPISYRPLAARLGVTVGAAFELAIRLAERGHVRMTHEGVGTGLRFVPLGTREPGDEPSTAYRGPYPIRSHRTCAEWGAQS